jgi:hypothetical protein
MSYSFQFCTIQSVVIICLPVSSGNSVKLILSKLSLNLYVFFGNSSLKKSFLWSGSLHLIYMQSVGMGIERWEYSVIRSSSQSNLIYYLMAPEVSIHINIAVLSFETKHLIFQHYIQTWGDWNVSCQPNKLLAKNSTWQQTPHKLVGSY